MMRRRSQENDVNQAKAKAVEAFDWSFGEPSPVRQGEERHLRVPDRVGQSTKINAEKEKGLM